MKLIGGDSRLGRVVDALPRGWTEMRSRPVRPAAWVPPDALEEVDVIVVIPVGPGEEANAIDTLESLEFFAGTSTQHILLVNDTGEDALTEAIERGGSDSVSVVDAQGPNGLHNLARTEALGFKVALDGFDFRILCKMDTDALVVGFGVFEAALAFAQDHPNCGTFGRFDRNADGGSRQFDNQAVNLRKKMRRWPGPFWRELLEDARAVGLKDGAHVFGGTAFYRYETLVDMRRRGVLEVPEHSARHFIGEDLYYSLGVAACGWQLGHFAAPQGPLALAWQDLPFTVDEILKSGYALVHSVDKGPRAQGSRARFRAHRASLRGP
jgi:hypothetical protein